MNDNPFFSMDQPQAQPAQAQVTPSVASPPPPDPSVGQDNPFFAMQDPASDQAPQPKRYSGSILPMSRNADGSMNWFDSNAGIVGDAKNFIKGIPGFEQQVSNQTASNTASPDTAGFSAKAASLLTPGDMMAPGLSGKAVKSGVQTPTEAELLKAGGKDLDAARATGVDYSIPHAVDLSHNVEQQLYNQGIGPADAPRTFAKLAEARNVPDDAVAMPISGLMGARRGFSGITADKTASDMDRAASAAALGHYQDFLENPPPEAVLAGPASSASDLVAQGNANYAAGKRSNLITNKDESADLRTSSTNSGRNYDNVLRQKVRPLVDPDNPLHNLINSWTPDEQQGVRDIVKGSETRGQNALRTIGNMGAGGHGIAASGLALGTAALGEHLMGPMGMVAGSIPPVAGSIARSMQNSNARAAVEGLGEKLRQRSPLYEQRVANAPYTVNQDTAGIAAARAPAAMAPQTEAEPGHPFYARGGKVKKPTHEFLVTRLMALAEKAKKAEKKHTAPILNMPDDAVTAALAKAQEAI